MYPHFGFGTLLAPKTSSYPPWGLFWAPGQEHRICQGRLASAHFGWGKCGSVEFCSSNLRNMNSMDATSPILSDDLPTSEWFLSHKPYIFLEIVHSSSAWKFHIHLAELKLGPLDTPFQVPQASPGWRKYAMTSCLGAATGLRCGDRDHVGDI